MLNILYIYSMVTQPIIDRLKKNYNRVVIFFCRPMKKRAKIGHLSADTSADYRPIRRPTVGRVYVITVI